MKKERYIKFEDEPFRVCTDETDVERAEDGWLGKWDVMCFYVRKGAQLEN